MTGKAVFVGGPKHGELDKADLAAEYIDPVWVWRTGLFGRRISEIEHQRGTYWQRRYFFFGRLVTVMVDSKLEPEGVELDRLLADALLNDKAKAASTERPA